MITTDKILAHKVQGKNLILLKQVGSSYFVVLAQVTRAKKSIFGALTRSASPSASIKVLAQREVSAQEAQAIFTAFNDSQATAASNAEAKSIASATLALSGDTTPADQTINSDVLLLAGSVAEEKPIAKKAALKPTASPYFPTKDIFLSAQQTRAPAAI